MERRGGQRTVIAVPDEPRRRCLPRQSKSSGGCRPRPSRTMRGLCEGRSTGEWTEQLPAPVAFINPLHPRTSGQFISMDDRSTLRTRALTAAIPHPSHSRLAHPVPSHAQPSPTGTRQCCCFSGLTLVFAQSMDVRSRTVPLALLVHRTTEPCRGQGQEE